MRYSDEVDDPEKLLAVATKMGLEGIVSKLGHHPYKSGKNEGQDRDRGQSRPLRIISEELKAAHAGSSCAV
jgi:hypothetical protein